MIHFSRICRTTFLVVFLSSLRVVFWNDANGSTFYLKPVGGEILESHDLVIEDCTVRRNFETTILCIFFTFCIFWAFSGGLCTKDAATSWKWRRACVQHERPWWRSRWQPPNFQACFFSSVFVVLLLIFFCFCLNFVIVFNI